KVRIKEKGSVKGQGVGHLPNGAMVVVENASRRIGQEVEVKIVRQLESPSGRMAFARIVKK
ncbi:TRAM domain-containing protein, partial [Candidatus Saccharibacteria bacterium]|nr:TRAM domain-containing protein [Candidatus Saccharibacteria bacterium]